MCGIAVAAFGNQSQMSKVIEFINIEQEHRGPDDTQIFLHNWFVAGHTRLSINGLGEKGRQPLFSRDGRWCVIFNGEIYNYLELQTEYGLKPLSDSDGGVIPELLTIFGSRAFSLLRGMFAVVAMDLSTNEMLVTVDPLGIKPLHWIRNESGTVVASEALPLWKLLPTSELDLDQFSSYLLRGSLSAEKTGFRMVQRVPPGTVLRFLMDSSIQLSSNLPEVTRNPSTWHDSIEKFRLSVKRHLIADVPIALLLSDGVDSTALALEMAKQGENFTAVTVEFGNQTRNESAGAEKTARELGLEHRIVSTVPDRDCIEDFFNSLQRPTIDGLNSYLVFREIKKLGFKVAISGLGADEILTGYVKPWMPLAFNAITALPAPFAEIILAKSSSHLTRIEIKKRLEILSQLEYEQGASRLVSFLRQIWTVPEILNSNKNAKLSKLNLTEFSKSILNGSIENSICGTQLSMYLSGQLLPDGDALSMAHSIELRVPFLDVDFINSVTSIRNRKLTKKDFVEEYGSQLLLDSYLKQKQGFTIPMSSWMKDGVLSEYVDCLFDSSEPIYKILGLGQFSTMINDWHLNEKLWPKVWAVVVLNEWIKRNA